MKAQRKKGENSMTKKKVIAIILVLGIIGSAGMIIKSKYTQTVQASDQDIKLMSYKASDVINENSFQIDKYENIESIAWINDNEVLTLSKKGEFKNRDSTTDVKYCSIYNLNTKESKDFKEVNIDDHMPVKISTDKRYVLYVEPRTIPKIHSDEWQKALDSGDLLHRTIKILDLITGDIIEPGIEKNNRDAQFEWIGNDKLLINYNDKWVITNVTGKVIEEGSFKTNSDTFVNVVGFDDIKDLDTGLKGKMYYFQHDSKEENGDKKLLSMDINAKEIKNIFSNKNVTDACKMGTTVMVQYDYGNNEDNAEDEIIHGFSILDESGKVLHDIKLPADREGGSYALSPDGSKAGYIEGRDLIDIGPAEDGDVQEAIKIIDTKTGNIKEIVKVSDLDKKAEDDNGSTDKADSNGNDEEKKAPNKSYTSRIYWDSKGTSLFFRYKKNTYVVSFDN